VLQYDRRSRTQCSQYQGARTQKLLITDTRLFYTPSRVPCWREQGFRFSGLRALQWRLPRRPERLALDSGSSCSHCVSQPALSCFASCSGSGRPGSSLHLSPERSRDSSGFLLAAAVLSVRVDLAWASAPLRRSWPCHWEPFCCLDATALLGVGIVDPGATACPVGRRVRGPATTDPLRSLGRTPSPPRSWCLARPYVVRRAMGTHPRAGIHRERGTLGRPQPIGRVILLLLHYGRCSRANRLLRVSGHALPTVHWLPGVHLAVAAVAWFGAEHLRAHGLWRGLGPRDLAALLDEYMGAWAGRSLPAAVARGVCVAVWAVDGSTLDCSRAASVDAGRTDGRERTVRALVLFRNVYGSKSAGRSVCCPVADWSRWWSPPLGRELSWRHTVAFASVSAAVWALPASRERQAGSLRPRNRIVAGGRPSMAPCQCTRHYRLRHGYFRLPLTSAGENARTTSYSFSCSSLAPYLDTRAWS